MAAPIDGPGPVAWAHRLTIVTALLGALAYAAWEFSGWAGGGGPGPAVRGTVALGIAAGFGLYLRRLRARLIDKLTPRHPA
jgi:hypothetical protein